MSEMDKDEYNANEHLKKKLTLDERLELIQNKRD